MGLPRPTHLVEVSQLFLSHVWPGNVRELQSVLEHAVI
jgi:transcriptional regulator with PAS, ATPase and Fis domain